MHTGRPAVIILAFASLLGSPALSQAGYKPSQTFDAASIQKSLPSAPTIDEITPIRLRLHNLPVSRLIRTAYRLQPYQLQAPAWMDDEDFTIDAETQRPASRSQMDAMLRLFLIRQFGLVTHQATRSANVYALLVAQGGFKLAPQPGVQTKHTFAELRSHQEGGVALYEVLGRGDLDYLASTLGPLVDRPVVNHTGIAGTYSFDLRYTPGPEMPNLPKSEREKLARSPGPSLFTALSKQFGLRLEKRQDSFPVLVIDHATKLPLGN